MAMGLLTFEAMIKIIVIALVLAPWACQAQLSTWYYSSSCPDLETTVNSVLQTALMSDGRIGASLLRMHFHDCFVQGCDGSVLLADTSTFKGEQTAVPNINSLRGFDVVDNIKAAVEAICPGTVSCADLLALIARDAVISAGGPYWSVEYGRKDSTTACLSCANNQIPSPFGSVSTLTSAFGAKGLDQTDMVTLSGAHTFGKAHCSLIANRLYNFSGTDQPDPRLNSDYLYELRWECPQPVSTTTVVNLDETTPYNFDNSYYSNLLSNDGLLTTDQALEDEGGYTASLVSNYAYSQWDFFYQFPLSMLKMGEISPLTGSEGEIRHVCSLVN